VSTVAVSAGLLTWFGLFLLLVGLRVLRGDFGVGGMLAESPTGAVTPERVLSMAIFPVILVSYVLSALQIDVRADPRLPDISANLVSLLTGSNGLYLAGKIARNVGGSQ
jgi:hypothetical protein